MGKLKISDDLRGKLDNVLGAKSTDVKNDMPAIAPAPKWNNEKCNIPSQPPPPPLQKTFEKNEERETFKDIEIEDIIYKKMKKKLILFSDGIFIGMGLILGIKIGTLLFY